MPLKVISFPHEHCTKALKSRKENAHLQLPLSVLLLRSFDFCVNLSQLPSCSSQHWYLFCILWTHRLLVAVSSILRTSVGKWRITSAQGEQSGATQSPRASTILSNCDNAAQSNCGNAAMPLKVNAAMPLKVIVAMPLKVIAAMPLMFPF